MTKDRSPANCCNSALLMWQKYRAFKIQSFKVNRVFPPQTLYGRQAKAPGRNREEAALLHGRQHICYSWSFLSLSLNPRWAPASRRGEVGGFSPQSSLIKPKKIQTVNSMWAILQKPNLTYCTEASISASSLTMKNIVHGAVPIWFVLLPTVLIPLVYSLRLPGKVMS